MKWTIILLIFFLLSACSTRPASEFEQNLQLWKQAGVAHYRFSLSVMCFCPYGQDMPFQIEVDHGEIISITDDKGAEISSSDPRYEFISPYGTIDELFSTLADGLNGEADDVSVKYDPTLGYPNLIRLDYIDTAVDDELALQVLSFESHP